MQVKLNFDDNKSSIILKQDWVNKYHWWYKFKLFTYSPTWKTSFILCIVSFMVIRAVITTLLTIIAGFIFLTRTVTYDELYICNSIDGTPCPALYSSEIESSQFTALTRLASDNYEGIGKDTFKNAAIFLIPVAFLLTSTAVLRKHDH